MSADSATDDGADSDAADNDAADTDADTDADTAFDTDRADTDTDADAAADAAADTDADADTDAAAADAAADGAADLLLLLLVCDSSGSGALASMEEEEAPLRCGASARRDWQRTWPSKTRCMCVVPSTSNTLVCLFLKMSRHFFYISAHSLTLKRVRRIKRRLKKRLLKYENTF